MKRYYFRMNLLKIKFVITFQFTFFQLQYSLLQTVVEACQKKRHCKFIAAQKALQTDPCPAVRKFVEVSYKCRPCK
jgi:hypothetical protein